MITIQLPDDVARLVYDELQGRLEWLGSTDRDEIHERVYAAVEATLDAAGSGPSPLGTYGPANVPDYVRESWESLS